MTSGAEEPGTWTPQFPGQRPPFQPGNEQALVTGHRSERYVGPLAERIAEGLLTDPDVPPHIREPMFAAASPRHLPTTVSCRRVTSPGSASSASSCSVLS